MHINKKEIEEKRKLLSLKSMYFNRYLGIRYMTAAFFFINIYWFFLLSFSNSFLRFLPFFIIIFSLSAVWEQMKLYDDHHNNPKISICYYWGIFFLNLILSLCTITPFFKFLYPFLQDTMVSKIIMCGFLLTGTFVSSLMLLELYRIRKNRDSQYERVILYEKSLNIKRRLNDG